MAPATASSRATAPMRACSSGESVAQTVAPSKGAGEMLLASAMVGLLGRRGGRLAVGDAGGVPDDGKDGPDQDESPAQRKALPGRPEELPAAAGEEEGARHGEGRGGADAAGASGDQARTARINGASPRSRKCRRRGRGARTGTCAAGTSG